MDTGDALSTSQKDPNSPNAPSDTDNSFHLSLGNALISKNVNYSVEASRTTVVDYLPSEVPEVDFAFFQDYILPPLNDKIQIQDIIRKLETQKIIVNGRWAAFPLDPWEYASGSGDKENAVFSHLTSVIKEIISHSGIDDEKVIHYVSRPNSNLVCCYEEDRKAARPDGYFLFEDHTQRFNARDYGRDILTPAEFKLKDNSDDLQDDIKKICWNMYQVMKEDPRRRFVFGFTVENSQMRVWLMSRAEVIVSQPFNFITDHEKFAHFVLSQVYAKPHELGIDTNMTIVKGEGDDSTLVYDIVLHHVQVERGRKEVDPIIVRTVRLINDDGVKYPLGQGTRVWRVNRLVHGKVDKSAPGRVLKESWVDEDREREGAILEQIRNQPEVIADDDLKPAFEGLFLTPVASGDVLIEGHPDSTRGLITRGAEIPTTAVIFSLKVSASHQPSHAVHGTGSRIPIVPSSVRFRQRFIGNINKQHYRVLFAEECKPLSKETSLRNVFHGLAEITDAGFGWVHRDISIGNIMYHRKSDKWKLSDVEFAKRLDVESAHEIRTGTANFMALEVDNGMYLYSSGSRKPRVSENQRQSIQDIAKRMNRQNRDNIRVPRDEGRTDSSRQLPPEKVFHYNPTHDLESLWWIAVYFVINKETTPTAAFDSTLAMGPQSVSTANHEVSVPFGGALASEAAQQLVDSTDSTPSPPTSSLTVEQRQYARQLFYSREARFMAMCSEVRSEFDNKAMGWPTHLKAICMTLIKLRENLRKHYTIIEKPEFVITNAVCNDVTDLYTTFRITFNRLKAMLDARDITVAPLPFDLDEKGVLYAAAQKSARASACSSSVKINPKRKSRTEDHPATNPPASKKQKPNTRTRPSVDASVSVEMGDGGDMSDTGIEKDVTE
ncbi:hypothetical protein BDY19DRAFT_906557 [Irpex rosettiformis]|uniref:Uncharacterized protein n=1 Tax=Irpex rosettiformis TaxID=378272 RepID=A0ACB8U2S2_9APHY|nr:hypothetical protein BDY19DRAFT_906557 [Irpex rosettiformis]